jgi:hypothetical protein
MHIDSHHRGRRVVFVGLAMAGSIRVLTRR